MNVDTLSDQVTALSNRLSTVLSKQAPTFQPTPELTSVVFKELGFAIEELQMCIEELKDQNESLSAAIDIANEERKRYESLFQFAPQAYLVTDLTGRVQEANRMAAQLLGISVEYLIGKPLPIYIHAADRPRFWQEVRQRQLRDGFQEWEMRLDAPNSMTTDIACSAIAIRDYQNNLVGFRWALRDITARKRIEKLDGKAPDTDCLEDWPLQDRPRQVYKKGDAIPVLPQVVHYVNRGLVKLTTLTEQNKEVLLGFMGEGSPFGPFLTALPIYEATALSDVELVPIAVSEMTQCPELSQFLLLKMKNRLHQAEILISISAEHNSKERLYQLLQFLKTEIGQPVAEGIRLGIRLTHEELACACCSTRVTTTRLLGRLRMEGKILFDDDSHIILTDAGGADSGTLGHLRQTG